jgi:sodium-dependent dicarboxylate transporter 2/3/5
MARKPRAKEHARCYRRPAVADRLLSESEQRFDRVRRKIGLFAAPALFALVWWLPLPSLDRPAHALAAVAAAVVALWITEAIPLAAAAVLGPAMAVVLDVAEPEAAFAAFADPLIFLFLGGFLLASGLARQGFDRRAALWLISRRFVAGSPRRALVAVSAISFLFSMWISNTATTAMLLPVALGLYGTIERVAPSDPETRRKLRRYGGGMCLLLAYSASLGGMATPIGTGPNVIAIGMLKSRAGVEVDFLQWMAFGVPIAVVMTSIAVMVGLRTFAPPIERVEGLTAEVERQLAEIGPMRRGEATAIAIFGLAILGWLSPSLLNLGLGAQHPVAAWAGRALDEGVVAIVAAGAMFIVPTERPDPDDPAQRARVIDASAFAEIDWGTILLLGGGLALGRLTFDTGLAEAMGRGVIGLAGPLASHPLGLMAAAGLLVILLTEVTSNTATTSMMLPVLIGIAKTSGFDPSSTAIVVTLAASHAFMLPVSTPPNAMAYGTRLIRIDDMVRVGLRLDVYGYLVLVLFGATLIPWIVG